ncbi:iron ABC transporter permease [Enterococcus sp. BWT-B8]|uniref:FecCD family ABC transporter permease n=1 Tax=Enterococcus sp. BWT-B8 TaxID=2885157 RepID=UPI001E6118B8|nr:iron ABC transporter permease [Enterococcus sp. BWT-B8]MCB5951691.1 iron ABC transporter permease [Enterococcus sp. BWT-B8]
MSKKKIMVMYSLFLMLTLAAALFSLMHGQISVSFEELCQVFLGGGSRAQRLLILDFRLPRILLAVLAGGALGLSGTILQSVTQNPLADTGIMGINAGAGFTVLLFISFIETSGLTVFLLPAVALIGALAAAGGIVWIAYDRRKGITPVRMVLTGVVLSTGISALTILLMTKLDSENYRFVTMWQAGSIWGSSWTFVWALIPWLFISFLLTMHKHRIYDIFQLGDEASASVGVSVGKERLLSLILAVAVAASAISVTGGINFLGLIAPHIVRGLGFKKHRELLPASLLVGGLLLVVSDTIGRLLLESGEIPAGVIVAIVGAPYFLYLLLKSEK